MILVDFVSTHNYIDINFSKQQNLFVYPTKDLAVAIVDGQKVKGVGKFHVVSVQIQELELQTGFYALLILIIVLIIIRLKFIFITLL
jgi:hypothetical protein